MIDVEPFPRLKIMMLCDIIMNYLKQLPEELMYRHLSYEYCKHIMKVVDENESIIDIEEKLSGIYMLYNIFIVLYSYTYLYIYIIIEIHSAEDLINQLHGEVTLLKNWIEWRPWEDLKKENETFDAKEFFFVNTIIQSNII